MGVNQRLGRPALAADRVFRHVIIITDKNRGALRQRLEENIPLQRAGGVRVLPDGAGGIPVERIQADCAAENQIFARFIPIAVFDPDVGIDHFLVETLSVNVGINGFFGWPARQFQTQDNASRLAFRRNVKVKRGNDSIYFGWKFRFRFRADDGAVRGGGGHDGYFPDGHVAAVIGTAQRQHALGRRGGRGGQCVFKNRHPVVPENDAVSLH